MDPFFSWIETSELSDWIRGSDCICAFPTIIVFHTLGMGFLAGGSAAIDLRILGFAPGISLNAMGRFMPLLWLAFAMNAISGTLLLIAYPTKALTNPVFYVKVCLIAVAVWLVYRIGVTVFRVPEIEQKVAAVRAKPLALVSLLSWLALITAGRLLAYTHKWEMLGVPSLT